MDSKLKILLVEDDALERQILRDWLSDGPYEFIEATDGEEAYSLALRELPDVVVTDLILPKVNGDVLIMSLRLTKEFGAVPIVAVTGSSTDMQLQAKLAGANVVLSKPIDREEALQRFESLLAASPFLREKKG
jgi:CheY-like chemotaxis protein